MASTVHAASSVATWPMVTLGEVLSPVSRSVRVDASQTYPLLGMRWYAGGLYIKERKLGAQIQADILYEVRKGDFVYNRLFAWKGSFGLADDNADGCFVSNEFPCFQVDEARACPGFLRWYFTQEYVWNAVEEQSSGSTPTSRLRLKEPQFLALQIPLPPLDEQQRIVARIEELAGRIAETKGLREEALAEVEQVLVAEELRVWPDESLIGAPTLEEITTYLSRGRQSKQGESDHYLIKTQHVQQGKYVPSRMTLAPEVAAKVSPAALARPDDILIACSAAGCLGRVARFDGSAECASTDTHVAIARANPGRVLPEYLYLYLRGAQGQVQLRSRQRGDWTKEKVGFRLLELNLADLKRVPVPLPTPSQQQAIVNHVRQVQANVDMLRATQEESALALNVLLPSVLDQAFRGEL